MNSRRNLGLPKFRSVNLSKGNSVQQTMIAPRVAEATSSKPSWSNQTTGRQGLWGSEVARKALSIWSGSVSQQPNLLPAAQDSLIRQAAFPAPGFAHKPSASQQAALAALDITVEPFSCSSSLRATKSATIPIRNPLFSQYGRRGAKAPYFASLSVLFVHNPRNHVKG